MAPTIPGTNCITMAEDALVALLSRLSSFQFWCGEGGEVEAARHIHMHATDGPGGLDRDTYSDTEWLDLFPCALVVEPEQGASWSLVQRARDVGIRYDLNLEFGIWFEAYATPGAGEQDAVRIFRNATLGIIQEVQEVAGVNADELAPTLLQAGRGLYRRPYEKRQRLGDVIGYEVLIEKTVEG